MMRERNPACRAVCFLAAATIAFAAPSPVVMSREPLSSLASAPASDVAGPETPSGEDIVVLGRKIRKVRLQYALWGAHMKRCDAVISSGDADIDRFVCTVLNACIKDGFRDPVPAKACLDQRIASVEYRPQPWDSGEPEPAGPEPAGPKPADIAKLDPVSMPSPIPSQPPEPEIVVTGGRPHVVPGLWRIEQSTTFSETINPQFQPHPGQVRTVCIAPEHVEPALENLLSAAIGMSGGGLCTMSTVRVRNGKVTGGRTCSLPMGSLSYDLHGKVNGDSMEAAVTITGETAHSKTRFRRRVTGSRIGTCPA